MVICIPPETLPVFGDALLTVGGGEARTLASLTAPGRLFRRGEPLALMPYAFSR